jgi:hypothetical protein
MIHSSQAEDRCWATEPQHDRLEQALTPLFRYNPDHLDTVM